ncbi:MAG TPA: hypothetical protein ENN42_06880 [Thioalkalivibrio sp.]|nr:hypothetical protein [Thioalkalivibrio sp.]
MKYLVSSVWFLSALLLAAPLLADEGRGGEDRQDARTAEAQTESRPSPGGRLRFRDGPVCMCSQGMSEEDIQRSREKRR